MRYGVNMKGTVYVMQISLQLIQEAFDSLMNGIIKGELMVVLFWVVLCLVRWYAMHDPKLR